jgi:hypothetical protein
MMDQFEPFKNSQTQLFANDKEKNLYLCIIVIYKFEVYNIFINNQYIDATAFTNLFRSRKVIKWNIQKIKNK